MDANLATTTEARDQIWAFLRAKTSESHRGRLPIPVLERVFEGWSHSKRIHPRSTRGEFTAAVLAAGYETIQGARGDLLVVGLSLLPLGEEHQS